MKTKIIIPTILLLLTLSASSCERMLWTNCANNNECITINIRGRLHIAPSGEGLEGVYVEARAGRSGSFSIYRRVASGRTNSNGEFDFRVRTHPNDASFVVVRFENQENYLHLENSRTIWPGTLSNGDIFSFNFEFLRKVPLTLNLNRTQTGNFDRFTIHSSARSSSGRFVGSYRFNVDDLNAESTTRQIVTAADVYTIIRWWKQLNGNVIYERVDSIIARPNENNVFTIDF